MDAVDAVDMMEATTLSEIPAIPARAGLDWSSKTRVLAHALVSW